MPTLNDILTANGDYTPVSGYPVDDKYENDSPVINVYDRTIGEIVGDTSTSGENVSQYLTFRIPRHPDHYDLIENGTNIRILYRLEDDTGEDVVPVNVVANDDYIIFGWKIPLIITVKPGVVTFIIHAYKSENNLITYHYKTLPKTYRILETMETDVVVPEIEMYNLAEAYARGTITDVFGHTRPVEENEPGYHDNSKYYKELAGTSKIDAETAKNAAEVAKNAAEAAQHAAENARDQAVAIVGGEYVSYGQTQSLNDTQKNKARENIGATEPNGYYPNMTVGLSENFVGTGEPTRRIFNYDTAGGSADISDGNAEIEKMYGDTVVWNQAVNEYIEGGHTESGLTWHSTEYSVSVSGTLTTAFLYDQVPLTQPFTFLRDGRKYLITLSKPIPFDIMVSGYSAKAIAGTNGFIWTNTTGGVRSHSLCARIPVGSVVDISDLSLNSIDLTQMFGSTIADDIYSLEQSQAGAGVAWFKKLFPLDYYPYDEGALLNVNPAGIKTVGFNAYDKATGKAELIGGNRYQITGTYTSLSYSTGEVLTPDSTGCFTPTKTGELTVTGGGENTCVHLTWSGYRNGDYEDYLTRTRDINVQPYFPDGLKRAGTVYDEISKDKAVKRIGVVDLGTLNWTYYPSETAFYCTINVMNRKNGNLLCSKYTKSLQGVSYLNNMEFSYQSGADTTLWFKNTAYTDETAFKAAMQGVMLYYELAEPVETQIDPPLNLLYQVSDFGTEQFLGAGATEPKTLPIVADIVYSVNYRDTIKNLPKNYAKVRGYYPDLYTGLADNLIDRKGNGTPQEISYRTSCGDDSIADDGNGIIQSIFGKTVVWNQLANKTSLTTAEISNLGNGTKRVSFTDALSRIGASCVAGDKIEMHAKANHKYLYWLDAFLETATYLAPQPFANTEVTIHDKKTIGSVGVWDRTYCIFSSTIEQVVLPQFHNHITENLPHDFLIKDYSVPIPVFDLTQMFGAGNEPSTLDDPRIKWIKDYANEYPEYNIGELISYNGSGIKTVGFNQFDKNTMVVENVYIDNNDGAAKSNTGALSTDFIPVIPNATYFINTEQTAGGWGAWYDADKNYISGITGYANVDPTYKVKIAPDNAHYMRLTCKYNNIGNIDTLCINLSWSGYRNGEYEPYWSRTLNLPISTYFPDGMKSAGSVRDELTKDKAVKKIGVVDLGTLEWKYDSTYDCFNADPRAISGTMKDNPKLVCSKYPFVGPFTKLQDKTCAYIYLRTIAIRDSSYNQDATAFKAAMSGVMLVYELAEPIETTITPPLDLTYKVADFGTEESITEVKSTPFNGIIKYSDDFTRGLVNMPKNYDTTASLDALAASLSAMLTSALNGTVTITRGAYDPATKKYEWNCQFTKNQVN